MPRISASTVEAHRALMTDRLLDALEAVTLEKGYDAATLAEIAARAGIARNTVYTYVPDKHALLELLMAREVDRFVERARREIRRARSAPTRLTRFIRLQVHGFTDNPMAGHDYTGLLDAPRLARMYAHLRPIHDLLAEILRDGMATGELRTVPLDDCVTMVMSVITAERVPLARGTRSADTVAARVTDFVLHALRP